MAAPEYVPQPAIKRVRGYESPPRRPQSWRPDRPGDSETGFARGDRLGAPGPDQGYIYVLARRFHGQLQLASDESEADAMVHDLTVALTVWGFLGDAPPDLIAYRQPLFAEVANPVHYPEQRRVVDLVPDDVLRRTPEEIAAAHRADWRSVLAL